jgi:bifunctional DNA-binding transcriptional regulator/antitoxin component of YhaV-PrlF toxin-antitoxin module
MKISEHGQITIPTDLQKQYGFSPDTDIEFLADGNSLRIIKKEEKTIEDEVKNIYGKKSFKKSTNELMEFLRK